MDRGNLLERVRECSTLPSLPTVALRVLELTQHAEFDLADIARAISKDPALSSKILRTVNSSFYGNGHTVSTISQALVLLGSAAIRTLVIGFSLGGSVTKTKTTAFDRAAYWRRCVYAATAARILCDRMQLAQQETAFLAGLLMDIGMLALDQVLGEEYGAVTARVLTHGELSSVETQVLGVNHAEVSGFLARQWKFPLALQVPMEFHHQAQEVKEALPRQLSEVVALAGRIADVFVDKNPVWSVGDARRMAGELLKLDEPGFDELVKEIAAKTQQLAPLFEVKIDPNLSCEALLRTAGEKIPESPGGAAAPGRQDERRRSPRVKKSADLCILPCLGGVVRQSTRVQLIDLSARGMGFSHEKPMEKGAQFLLQTRKPDGTPMTLLYEIVRCEKNSTRGFSMGAELVCVLNDGQQKTSPRQHAPGAAEKISKAIVN